MGKKDLYSVGVTALAGAEAIGIFGLLVGAGLGYLAIKKLK